MIGLVGLNLPAGAAPGVARIDHLPEPEAALHLGIARAPEVRAEPLGRFKYILPAATLAAALACGDTPIDPPPPEPEPRCEVPAAGPGAGAVGWSDPEPIPTGLDRSFSRSRIAAAGDRLHVAFETYIHEGMETRTPGSVHVVTREGGTWGPVVHLPGTPEPAGYPLLALARDGQPLVLWGEREGEEHPSGTFVPNVLLSWHVPGGASVPDTVYRSSTSNISSLLGVPPLAPDPQGRLHIIYRLPGYSGFIRRVWTDGVWEDSPPIFSAGGSGPAIAVTDSGELLVIFVMGVLDAPGGIPRYSLYLTRSADSGATWSTPVSVFPYTHNGPRGVRIAVAPDGRIHVIWAGSETDPFWPDFVGHVHSMDGLCWSEPARLEFAPGMPAMLDDPGLVVDERGGVHLAVISTTDWFSQPHRLFYAYWESGEWTEPEPLFGFDPVNGVGLTRDDTGRLHLAVTTWGLSPEDGGLYHATGVAAR